MSDRLVFHVRGGARGGGVTLTTKSTEDGAAIVEAESYFRGREMLDTPGKWLADPEPTGPDDEGNRYWHRYWIAR